jgi:hypothetical protein
MARTTNTTLAATNAERADMPHVDVRPLAIAAQVHHNVSGVGALTAATMLLAEITGDEPDYGYAVRLGVIAAVLAVAPFVLYVLHHSGTRLGKARRRSSCSSRCSRSG